ncbi:MAG: hypothetical protein IJO91_03575 [Oscillospiraceae bacterium]|nr:hypothetical protein [Oscillospiraceae bacterium]
MEITKLIDEYGDDIFALALIVTKDFDSAKQVFVKTTTAYSELSDEAVMLDIVNRAYTECAEADSNEGATTLTGVELDAKRQTVLEEVLKLGEMTRTVIHLFYENDQIDEDIAAITGLTEKQVTDILSGLPADLADQLEEHYKSICTKIKAEDRLKAYVIRSVTSGNKRMFEVGKDAAPVHRWKTSQKVIVCVSALIITILICIVIPLLQQYLDMREREGYSSYENLSSGESFYIDEESED